MSVTGIGLSVDGGGSSVTVEPLSIAENGTYTAESGKAFSPVNVNVPYKTANFTFRFNNAIPAGLFVKCSVPYMNSGNIFTIVSTTKYSGQSQTIVLGEGGHTTATIVTEGWRFTIISGNAAFADNDHLRVTITGDCVLSVEPISGYKANLGKVADRTVTSILAEELAGIFRIGSYAFYSCQQLTSVVLPSSVTHLGPSAFEACVALSSINLDGVTLIGADCFVACSALTNITLSNNITSIGKSAFEVCTNLTSVTVPATTPPTLGSMAFDSTSAALVIYVPAESVEAYKAATNWSTYASKIQAIPNS